MTGIVKAMRENPPDSLPVFAGGDWEAHVHAWRQVREEIEDRLWTLGAIAASVTTRYGDHAIPEFARDVGYSPRRVYELAYTYRAWRYRDRAQDLSLKHHTVAARRRPDDPEAAIERAIRDRLSANELEDALREEEEREHGEPEIVEATRVCPACGGSGEVPA